MKDEIAVVIPNYKHEECLDRSIHSIQRQTVDCCNIYVAHDYPRMGKGFRLNFVVPFLSEAWLNVHDADDYSFSKRFEKCIPYFDDYDVIYHGVNLKNDIVVGQHEPIQTSYYSKPWDMELYKRENYVPASSVIVRMSIVKKVPWISNGYGQDWIWLNQIAQHTTRIKFVNEVLMYRRVDIGFTKNLKLKSIRRWNIRRKIRKLTS